MANHSLDDSFLTINLSLKQYDLLIETSAKANALTQVILAVTDLELLPVKVLHDFLWALDDLLYKVNTLCCTLKPLPVQTI